MFAVIKTGGKQYKVQAKEKIKIEKIAGEVGQEIDFKEVLLIADENNTKLGMPVVANASVKAKILAQAKLPKVVVMKYKRKVRYRRNRGHRQPFTQIQILSIKS